MKVSFAASSRILIACYGLFTVASILTTNAGAQPVFGSVTVYIGSGQGGGYDAYGRLVARHLGPHLPGAPSVTPQNMPGAGSVALANFMSASAPADGSALAIAASSLPLIERMDKAAVRFRSSDFKWIGRVAMMTNVTFVSKRAPAQTLEQAKNHRLLIAAISADSPLTLQPQTLAKYAGFQFETVLGYEDTNAAMLAVERGEADGTTVSWNTLKTQKADWLKSGEAKVLVQYARTRNLELTNVPTAIEFATSPDARKAITRYTGTDIGYAIFAPPSTPADKVGLLRKAFADMLEDNAFLSDLKALSLDLSPMNGAQLQALVEESSAEAADK
jgi:tripartite-type tricarboxylate transporter receptor subunit TctC